ncbi:MAG: hypothetical protein QNJ55_17365 [Xenococcus sp. MO_188.B8]|nr:hypothetical protein [Xenococcus sp. MO_188.B8]
MASQIENRPNYRLPITDPLYFVGRRELLKEMQQKPLDVRILLGGRRIGKTSTLNAFQWSLLDPNIDNIVRVFPVLIDLQVEQPKDLENLRYILIARLRESIDRWKQVPLASLREMYRSFIRQIASGEIAVSFLQQLNIKFNITNPDNERRLIHDDFLLAFLKTVNDLESLKFNGICFLLDGAEFLTSQDWANNAWSYLRGLKSDTAIKPFLGLLLSGYRELKEYQQAVGSQLLNIADIKWLSPLTALEMEEIIECRVRKESIELSKKNLAVIRAWSGAHPYLLQQILNSIFDICQEGVDFSSSSLKVLIENLIYEHDNEFKSWWNEDKSSGSFGDRERLIYQVFMQHRQGTIRSFAQQTKLSPIDVKNGLDILLGTGVIHKVGQGRYEIGTRLFEEWVKWQ